MSEQLEGLHYLASYSGVLKIIESVLNIAVLVFLIICGYETKTYFLNGVAATATVLTTIFLVINISTNCIRKENIPLFWMECMYSLAIGVLYFLSSSFVVSILTKGFVITGIVAYVAGLTYLLDTIDKYKLAMTPKAKYAWNTPNPPDYYEEEP